MGANPTRRTLQPEATGAVTEATRWLKPSVEEAGHEPDPQNWHVARTILVTETDQDAERYLANPDCAPRYCFNYLCSLMKKAGFSGVMKGLHEISDDELTVDWALDEIAIAGSPATVTDRINHLRDEIGPFGTLVFTGLDWDDKALWQRSMELAAKEVLPRLNGCKRFADPLLSC